MALQLVNPTNFPGRGLTFTHAHTRLGALQGARKDPLIIDFLSCLFLPSTVTSLPSMLQTSNMLFRVLALIRMCSASP